MLGNETLPRRDNSARPGRHLRYSDALAVLYLAAATEVALYLVHNVHEHPFLLAFIKFAMLATFGECLRRRIGGAGWIPSRLPIRAAIWGIFGIWIALAMMVMSAGVHALHGMTHQPRFVIAFATSAWINVVSGYGFFMMLTHFMLDRALEEGFRSPVRIMSEPGFSPWARTVTLCLIFFWTPAHTITFLLPENWRILFAAYLGVALGLLLSLAANPWGPRPASAAP